MMKVKYLETSHVGIYSRTGQYVEFKAGEEKEVTDEVAAELEKDQRFKISNITEETKKTEKTGNEVPEKPVKKPKRKVI